MCLHKLEKFRPCKEGYKIMNCNSREELCGEYYSDYNPRKVGVWLNERNFRDTLRQARRIKDGYHKTSYPFGFHVYHRKKDAIRHLFGSCGLSRLVCVRVATKTPVATGYQNDMRITVAKQIKILEVL